jgi:hypothetical protein
MFNPKKKKASHDKRIKAEGFYKAEGCIELRSKKMALEKRKWHSIKAKKWHSIKPKAL